MKLWIFEFGSYFCPFCIYLIMAIYFDQLNYPKAPIDRNFIAEHFGVLFAFFGLIV